MASFGVLGAAPPAVAAPSLPQTGLVMHLDATRGVEQSGASVSHWWDQSGYGQSLVASGSPRLVNSGPNGRAVVELDSAADRFRQTRNFSLPLHGNDRTLIVLSAADNASAELGYGGQPCGTAFGVRHDIDGTSGLSAGCSTPQAHAQGHTRPGNWQLQVLMVSSGTFYHFRNGELVDGRTAPLTTRNGAFQIQTPGLRKAARGYLRVASVLAYDSALTTQELRAVQRYIGSQWFNNRNHFKLTPNLRTLRLPKPQLALSQRSIRNNVLELNWRVSFADECAADTGWTNSTATSGSAVVRNAGRGNAFGLNCWHQSASASASFSGDTQPLRITWDVPIGQENDTTGYRLFLGKRSKRYNEIVKIPVNATNSHTLELAPGRYYVAMSTIGRFGRESSLSGEIAITVN